MKTKFDAADFFSVKPNYPEEDTSDWAARVANALLPEIKKAWLAESKKFCPCGGVILADTECFKTPLCIECHDQHVRELKASGVVVYSDDLPMGVWSDVRERMLEPVTHRAVLICVEEL